MDLNPPRILAFNPPSFPTAEIAIAAARAGFEGGIALEFCSPMRAQQLFRRARRANVRITVSIPSLNDKWRDELSAAAGCIESIAFDGDARSLSADIEWSRSHGLRTLVELRSLAGLRLADQLGVDGVIAKGNEGSGRVAEETTFVLLQQITKTLRVPVYARGGIGLHTAAACLTAGAHGLILDWQLALTPQAALPQPVRGWIERADGSESRVFGQPFNAGYRLHARIGDASIREIVAAEHTLQQLAGDEADLARWHELIASRCSEVSPELRVLALSQDVAFASALARRYRTTEGICRGIQLEAVQACRLAAHQRALRPGNSWANSHGTSLPVAQGPMTRVSDSPQFALEVARAGGLPFLALALMTGEECERVLSQTKALLEDRPWGVGLLGFIPEDVREQQVRQVRRFEPPFALFAGGRPGHAAELKKLGITSYLHVPSPTLLDQYLGQGSRHFVFEGRECGGHVGPRSSFVLWEQMVSVLLSHIETKRLVPADAYVLFAGGIHDSVSSAMVMAIAARIVEQGVNVAILMGTAYLFTEEIVSSRAVVEGYQQTARQCTETVLLESGVGHLTRAAKSPFASEFSKQKRALLCAGENGQQLMDSLERMNLGRLRLAAKGLVRDHDRVADSAVRTLRSVDYAEQRAEGMYMIGEVAALHEDIISIEQLHRCVTSEAVSRCCQLVEPLACATHPPGYQGRSVRQRTGDVAIIGMAGLLPGAHSVAELWNNIIERRSAITEVPTDHWDWRLFFDQQRGKPGKFYSKWGGFIREFHFDPVSYGMPPSSVSSIEPLQLLFLEVAHQALADSGYAQRPFPRETTSVILGAGGPDAAHGYGTRSLLPLLMHQAGKSEGEIMELMRDLEAQLPTWTEDSFPGVLTNVVAGRAANRLDLGGTNYAVDAACASSLAALRLGVNELQTHSSDLVIVGGADTATSPMSFFCFSETHALSPTGECRALDSTGDGTVISEGVVAVLIKRLEDAERDGDRIYAVIKGTGSASDGRHKGLTAPSPGGQQLALRRAYDDAGISPASVGLIEGHCTGTVVGDATEIESLSRVMSDADAAPGSIAIGSIKSMIGHTKCAAGLAGVMKAALALHHRLLPPTIGVKTPNPKIADSPLYVNTEARPWFANPGTPRRAGVNAFGFGGTNFHTVLEEHGERSAVATQSGLTEWPAELFIWRADSEPELRTSLQTLHTALFASELPALRDLAAVVCATHAQAAGRYSLAIVAADTGQLSTRLRRTLTAMQDGSPRRLQEEGIYYSTSAALDVKLAFLFPGQGSQHVDMLRELVLHYPGARQWWQRADEILHDVVGRTVTAHVYPPPALDPDRKRLQREALIDTTIAQPALGAANMTALGVFADLGLYPDFYCGHSFGELTALCAAGVIEFDDLIRLSAIRGQCAHDAARKCPGSMLAVFAGADTAREILAKCEDVELANFNSPSQTILSGTHAGISQALAICEELGVKAHLIAVGAPFHSSLLVSAAAELRKALSSIELRKPHTPVYANVTGECHGEDVDGIRELLCSHLCKPVKFHQSIEALVDQGVKLFVEVGPGSVLTAFVSEIARDSDVVAVATERAGMRGIPSLLHTLACVAACGVRFDAQRLFHARVAAAANLDDLFERAARPRATPTSWRINSRKAIAPNRAWSGKSQDGPPANAPMRSVAPDSGSSEQWSVSAPHPPPLAPSAARAGGGISQLTPVGRDAMAGADGIDEVMRQHQALMRRFLDVHEHVMNAYLSGDQLVAREMNTAPANRAVSEVPDRPNLSSAAAEAVAETAKALAPPIQGFEDTLAGLVSERTGYPIDLIGLDLDLEADLGIDSIKRFEIIGALRALCPVEAVGISPADWEGLARVRTLREVVARLRNSAGPETKAEPVRPAQSNTWPRDQASVQARVLQIISELTGYPPDLIGVDVDLERELGIDSIKRVEIAGALQKHMVVAPGKQATATERLSTLRSVTQIVEALVGTPVPVEQKRSAPSASSQWLQAASEPEGPVSSSTSMEALRRMLLKANPAPLVQRRTRRRPSTAVILMRRGNSAAQSVVQSVQVAGVQVVEFDASALAPGDEQGSIETHLLAVLDQLELRAHGSDARALINLLPFCECSGQHQEPDDFERQRRDSSVLLRICQALESWLQAAPAMFLTVTAMGGSFGSVAHEGEAFNPLSGAAVGFAKGVCAEWDGVVCRVVDFARDATANSVAAAILQELVTDDEMVEVGYTDRRRVALQPVEAVLDTSKPRLSLDGDSVVIVTGGARGIAASIARELAERTGCHLVVIGRTGEEVGEETADLRNIEDPVVLKAALVQQARQAGGPISLPAIERIFQALLRGREVRSNLQMLSSLAASVQYLQLDVTNAVGLAHAVASTYERHGRIDGVIHGAGIVEDRLLNDKTFESFMRVYETKVVPMLVFERSLRLNSLRFFVAISSMSARWGNRGQSDYAAANETLNKLVLQLARRADCVVKALNFGPWSGPGMVSPQLAQQFLAAGVPLISHASGSKACVDEILFGDREHVEVLLGAWNARVADHPSVDAECAPADMSPAVHG